MNHRHRAILVPLFAVLALVCGLAGTASAAFSHAATEPHYGNFLLRESKASEFSAYEIADPIKENGEWIYDCALGVPAYVRQNPWTMFDPLGLSSWGTFGSMPGTSEIRAADEQKFRETEISAQEASLAVDFFPGIGTVKGGYEVLSGSDPVTGNQLSTGERVVAGVGTVASLLPGGKHLVKGGSKLLGIGKHADEAVEITARGTKEASKKAADTATDAANRVVKCFPPGTAVVMADGTTKAIEDVEEGDIVMSADPERGAEPRPCRVAGILHSKTQRLITVGLDSNGDGVEDGSVRATGEHPFWAKGRGWVNAENLKPSDVLTSLSASSAAVVRVDTARSEAWISTYNLDVAGVDAFFVLAGRIPVLVHNTEIGLGLNDLPTPLNDLNRTRRAGALTFENAAWQKAGLTSVPFKEIDLGLDGAKKAFWRSFEQASAKASSIRFDVTSFDDARYLANPSGPMTARELTHILENPSLLEKTTFYRGGKIAVWDGTTFVCP